jgi:hypothetical protein
MKNANVSLQRFRFHLEPKTPLHLPAYNKGNVIRGGFGGAFRRIVCHAACRRIASSAACVRTRRCFQPFVPEGSEKMCQIRKWCGGLGYVERLRRSRVRYAIIDAGRLVFYWGGNEHEATREVEI